jgi:hypothetical protein
MFVAMFVAMFLAMFLNSEKVGLLGVGFQSSGREFRLNLDNVMYVVHMNARGFSITRQSRATLFARFASRVDRFAR